MRTHNIFVSHSWSYGDQYARLVALLRQRGWFSFRDYSVPQDDPVHTAGSDRELRAAIYRRMRPCHVVLVLAGVYATYSKWITIEVALAMDFGKPIVAVAPWASRRISATVREAADALVGWNTESIVKAIREVSR